MKEQDNLIPWAKRLYTMSRWENFLQHDFNNPARQLGYDIVKQVVSEGSTFLEVAFGQCYDFEHCFKQLPITYTGYDITPPFVELALEKYPDYDFRVGGFTDIEGQYDVSYTRHIFEHLHPDVHVECLKAFLEATNRVAIISWFLCPSVRPRYVIKQEDSIQFNIHDKYLIRSIVKQCGFSMTDHDASFGNTERSGHRIYVLERE